MNTTSTPMPDADLERIARRRAGAKMGWFTHACVYLVINAVFLAAASLDGRHWAVFPAVAWGVGLAIHGIAVFFSTGGGGLHARLLQRERERLQLQRDPW